MQANSYGSLDKTNTDWAIWVILLSFFLLVIILSFVYFSIKYKKEKRNIFELWKISIISIFLGIFLIQSYITLPMIDGIIPFSLDDVVIVVIGFMIGPLEAIVFGFVTDTTRTFINGWSYQVLPSLIFPLTGLIAGWFGELYRRDYKNKEEIKNSDKSFLAKMFGYDFIIFQFIVFAFALFTMITPTFINNSVYEDLNKTLIICSSILSFILLEFMFIYLMFFSKRQSTLDIRILLYITISLIISRILTGWVIRPYSMYFYWGYNFNFQLISRIATSSYLIPIKIITSYWVVKLFRQYYRNV